MNQMKLSQTKIILFQLMINYQSVFKKKVIQILIQATIEMVFNIFLKYFFIINKLIF